MDKENLIWIDLEFTGLSFEENTIIEIATIITDKNLNILAEGPNIAIHHPDEILHNMDPWCIEHFKTSGLTEESRKSTASLKKAEQETISFINQFVPKGCSPMCGNSTQQDRRILARLMPELEGYFSHRHIDVSTIKELARRWEPNLITKIQKKDAHRALLDVKESIDELKLYREYFFKL